MDNEHSTGYALIDGLVDEIKTKVVNLMYSENSKDDFETIVNINEYLKYITTEYKKLEKECYRQKTIASELRKQWGDAFSAECDEAGIE